MLLHDILEFAAVRARASVALVSEHATWTFGELHDRVASLSVGIAEVTRPGDRVAILAENTPEYVECYYAVPRAGAILVPLNYRLAPSEWADTNAHVEPRVLIGERSLLDRLFDGPGRPDSVETVVALDEPHEGEIAFETLRAAGGGVAPPDRDDHDTAWLLSTSGTTGRPKAAALTHRSLLVATFATAIGRPVRRDDVYLFPFPLCHVAGYNVLLFHLHARPVVLMRRFDPGGVLELVGRHGVTAVSLAPTMISSLLDHPGLGDADLTTLRSVGYGASAIPAEVLRRGLEVLGCDFAQGYGMTELSGNVVYLDAETHRRGVAGEEHLLAACGRPSPLAAVRVVDETMSDVPVGEAGEIVVRGDMVTVGYWNDPAATAEAFTGGWFHTGDVGRFDHEGFLYVVDRKKDVIVTGGENVSSREVEDVLHRHPGVREAAVIGLPDDYWGEAVCAVVVRREQSDVGADDLVALCREQLAGFKKPRHVVFVDELPKNHAGKVEKHRLREEIGIRLGVGELPAEPS